MTQTIETTSIAKLIGWFNEQADSSLKKLAGARIILKTGYTLPALLEKNVTDPKIFNEVKSIIEEMTGLKSPIQNPSGEGDSK
ncbi:MAG TPA: hypothetical protein VLY20_11170 [Nitrospiria bacterium]|nr:hypothetical protein [Nitrospiria bacterium]